MATFDDFVKDMEERLRALKKYYLRVNKNDIRARDNLAEDLYTFMVRLDELSSYANQANSVRLQNLRQKADALITVLKGYANNDKFYEFTEIDSPFAPLQEELMVLHDRLANSPDNKNAFLLTQLRGKAESLLKRAQELSDELYGSDDQQGYAIGMGKITPFIEFLNTINHLSGNRGQLIQVIKGGVNGWNGWHRKH
jgi:hypothetical protein